MSLLFRSPTEGDEREDAYSGPFGFLVGGLGAGERDHIAEQYFRAANLLVENIRQKNVADFEIAYPVLYLYRHAVEVLLKSLLGGHTSHHRLDALAGDLVKFAREKYDQQVPQWVTDRLHELARIDPTSQAFRYGEDKYPGKGDGRQPVPYETYVRVAELHDSMNRLFAALKGALDVERGR